MMTDSHEEIVALEQEIEALGERLEQGRKLALVARVGIGVGSVLLVAYLAGALGRSPTALVASLAALLGGFVLLGSNRSTLDEIRALIREREARRAALIEAMGLHPTTI